jgi:CubicO group peptidase (beta-lactamase class C family)
MSIEKKLPRATPASKGVDPAGIAAFLDAVERDRLELHSFMLFRGGAVVAEGFWRPYRPDLVHMQHSATKSWMATGVGLAIAEGRFGLADRVVDFFPEHRPADLGENLAAMTVEDLLTMRTGHRTGISGGEWRQMTGSWIAAFLREPVEEIPGKTFIYSSASSYMLSAIVARTTGQTMQAYLEPRLFRPLGMGEIRWDLSPEGINPGGNGLSCLTEDFLKLGVLHLQGGVWEGRRILPEWWVREATRNQVEEVVMPSLQGGLRYTPAASPTAADRREGYGYQWWMTPQGGYRASGLFGQQCIVLPGADAVIAVTAALRMGDKRVGSAIWEHLFPALGVPGADPAEEPALAARLAGLALPEVAGAPHSPVERIVSGRRWLIEPNEDAVTEIGLDFDEGRCVFTLTDHRGEHRIAVGLGRAIEGETTMTGSRLHHEYQPETMRVAAEGAWADDKTFVMRWQFVETAFGDTVVVRFDGDRVQLARSVNTNAAAMERPLLSGRALPAAVGA